MPKGSAPHPYNRSPKTGGMPPMGKPKAKSTSKPRGSSPKVKGSSPNSAAPKAASPSNSYGVPRSKSVVVSGPKISTSRALVPVSGAARATAGMTIGVMAAAAAVGMGIAGGAYAIQGDRFGKGQPARTSRPANQQAAATAAVIDHVYSGGPKGPSARNTGGQVAGVEKTKGGNYTKYKSGSAKAQDFQKAYAAAKGKDFSWGGRKYKGK